MDWSVVRAAFDAALEREDAQRATYLTRNYPADVAAEVVNLLRCHAAATNFLTPPSKALLSGVLAKPSVTDFEPQELDGVTIADRYEVGARIGVGGTAVVHEARDLLTGTSVAVKVGRTSAATEAVDFVRHEATALRLLRLPGVVELLDSGRHDGRSFMVMPRVEGAPFPGCRRTSPVAWTSIRRTTVGLFETLARVHWAGVVHCDLKPSNVLVEADGSPVLLDLGIAQDPGSDEELRRALALAGTPRYTAPEQLMGEEGTVRSDLYAVGVMLFEALSGRDPHDARDATEVLCFRPNVPPPSLATVAPDVPPKISRLVDSLIAADPDSRPPSAASVLERLQHEEEDGHRLPRFLGRRSAIDAVLTAVRQHKPIDIWGAPGAGRSSVLREVADSLREDGRQVAWVRPATAPFASLGPVFRRPFRVRARTSVDAHQQVLRALIDALKAGVIVFADDMEGVDTASASALEQAREHGALVRAYGRDVAGGLRIPPLDVADLETLFLGHERLHHIPSDAARELVRRTGGLPGEVKRELAAWERAGISRSEGTRVVIRRSALERLRSGLRVRLRSPLDEAREDPERLDILGCVDLLGEHASVDRCAAVLEVPRWEVETRLEGLAAEGFLEIGADTSIRLLRSGIGGGHWSPERRRRMHAQMSSTLPTSAPLRLHHWLMSGRSDGIRDIACEVGRGLLERGEPSKAAALLLEGIAASRRLEEPGDERSILGLLLRAALETGTATALDRVLYAAERAAATSDEHRAVDAIARAAQLGLQRDTARALSLVPDIDTLADAGLRDAATSVYMYLVRQLGSEAADTAVRKASGMLEPGASASSMRALRTAKAWLAYAREEYSDASRLHARAARDAPDPLARHGSLLNSASASLDAGDHETAARLAEEVRSWARERRHVQYEARAERILRAALYRSGMASTPDMELVAAVAALEVPHLEALTLLNEGAIAWRTGRRASAQDLSARAHGIWNRTGHPGPALLARSLGVAAGAEVTDEELAILARGIEAVSSAHIRAQAAHLASLAPSDARGRLKLLARDAAALVPRDQWDACREITSIREAVQ